jgi:hypothetical protein
VQNLLIEIILINLNSRHILSSSFLICELIISDRNCIFRDFVTVDIRKIK